MPQPVNIPFSDFDLADLYAMSADYLDGPSGQMVDAFRMWVRTTSASGRSDGDRVVIPSYHASMAIAICNHEIDRGRDLLLARRARDLRDRIDQWRHASGPWNLPRLRKSDPLV